MTDKMTAGAAISLTSFGIMMYTPIPIAVPAPKSVKSIVDKILLKEPSDKRERSGLVLVIFVNKLGYFEPKNEKTCC